MDDPKRLLTEIILEKTQGGVRKMSIAEYIEVQRLTGQLAQINGLIGDIRELPSRLIEFYQYAQNYNVRTVGGVHNMLRWGLFPDAEIDYYIEKGTFILEPEHGEVLIGYRHKKAKIIEKATSAVTLPYFFSARNRTLNPPPFSGTD